MLLLPPSQIPHGPEWWHGGPACLSALWSEEEICFTPSLDGSILHPSWVSLGRVKFSALQCCVTQWGVVSKLLVNNQSSPVFFLFFVFLSSTGGNRRLFRGKEWSIDGWCLLIPPPLFFIAKAHARTHTHARAHVHTHQSTYFWCFVKFLSFFLPKTAWFLLYHSTLKKWKDVQGVWKYF